MSRVRQEVLNVLIAQGLAERGVIAVPESILKSDTGGRKMPDVLVEYQGLRLIIEGEIESPTAQDKALASARKRVEDGVAHIGVAVVYPSTLRDADFTTIKEDLLAAPLHIAVVTESVEEAFVQGDMSYLERALRTAFDHLVQEDVVAQAVAAIDAGVERFAREFVSSERIVGLLADIFGVQPLSSAGGSGTATLTLEQRSAIIRIGGLVVCNAIIFQEVLISHNSKNKNMKPVNELVSHSFNDPILTDRLREQWKFIIEHINYFPIFHLAHEVVRILGSHPDAEKVLLEFGKIAKRIVIQRAALRHDLMGRIYHRLLSEAKYLGTYYTRIPAAALLLKLALYKINGGVVWHDLDAVGNLRIADLSCGTGTLLAAAADVVMDNYVHAAAAKHQTVDLDNLQKTLLEQVLYGYDVLPSAIHLTASTLALRAPQTTIGNMCLYCLPHGGAEHRLGSVEFFKGDTIQLTLDLFGSLPQIIQATGTKDETLISAPLPMLDLCAINPPFTRSVGGNLLFGSVPEAERKQMQKDLQKLVKQQGIPASITVGLGSVFIALADRYIKPGGRLALVIPKALLSGVYWGITRNMINQGYHIEYLIVSQDPERWNFSESTDLSEVLLIAVKHRKDEPSKDEPSTEVATTVINLWRNPDTAFEAMAVAWQVIREHKPDMATGQGALNLSIGKDKVGEAMSVGEALLKKSWLLPCTFAQSDLIRCAYRLQQGTVQLPGYKDTFSLPLCSLQQYGTLGPDSRDLYDGFEMTQSTTSYTTFWNHKSELVYTMAQKPNAYLAPLAQAKPGRKLKKATDLWPLAGHVLVADRLRTNSHKLSAIRLPERVLSNVWWELSLNETISETREKILVLWLNSTLALLLLLLHRSETQGAWMNFKKPTLLKMPVLDTSKLSDAQIATLEAAYDTLCTQSLLRISEMETDSVRAEIDASIAKAFGLPDVAPIRKMLAREPIMSQRQL